jgi:L-asparaginase II
MNPTLAEAFRGQIVESFHRGAVAVLDAEGATVLALGDVQRPIFPRSAIKGLQALPLVASGAADAFKLTDEQLAIACASHNGEPAHLATTRSMLAKAGVDESALECGAHWPYREAFQREMVLRGETPTAAHNNCSGKHAGFVCLGCHRAGTGDVRGFLRGYVRPQHGVMLEVTKAMAEATDLDLSHAPMGVDGCSIPTFAMPLQSLALGFARFATGQGLSAEHATAASRLRQAVARAPFMVGGTGRFDTVVMQQLGERVFCKVGAEGVYCAALPEQGLGVALKMDDGNNARAAEVVMAALIEALVPLAAADATFMRQHSDVRLRNWNGIEVGRLAASHHLRQVLVGCKG